MKVRVFKPVEIEVHAVRISFDAEYLEEVPPFMLDDRNNFQLTIEVDTGRIMNWPSEENIGVLDFSAKVGDCGTYTLLAADGSEIISIVEDYVPNNLIPGEYGDYIDLKISAEGVITNWPENPNVYQFFKDAETEY